MHVHVCTYVCLVGACFTAMTQAAQAAVGLSHVYWSLGDCRHVTWAEFLGLRLGSVDSDVLCVVLIKAGLER